MRRLDNKRAHVFGGKAFQRLGNRVDLQAVALPQLFQDHPACKRAAHRIIGIGRLQIGFDGADRSVACFSIACTE